MKNTVAVPGERVLGLLEFAVNVVELILNERILDLEHRLAYLVVEVNDQVEVDDVLAQFVASRVQFNGPVRNVLKRTTL